MRINRRRFIARAGTGMAGILTLGLAAPAAYSAMRALWPAGPQRPTLMTAKPLPDSIPGRSPTGFTGTGLDRIARGAWSGFWVVGDDGRLREGDASPFHAAIQIVAPDWSKVVATIPGPRGASIQGVAIDISGGTDTVWAACSANGTVRRYALYGDQAGDELVGDRIDLASLGIQGSANGLAFDPTTDTLLVSLYQGNKVYRLARKAKRLVETITLGVAGAGLESTPDHLAYDPAARRLMYSVGQNGRSGAIHAFDLASGRDEVAFADLKDCQAIEGFFLDSDKGVLTVISDGGFHHQAKPPLNQVLAYRIELPSRVAAS
jgi:sugar lactone lactonase YvrE